MLCVGEARVRVGMGGIRMLGVVVDMGMSGVE